MFVVEVEVGDQGLVLVYEAVFVVLGEVEYVGDDVDGELVGEVVD